MRNLKRVLSLALACVMVIGMMVMTTGAADLGDYDEITNTEAVDVMVALGVLEGDDLGNFNPEQILTREQAAKIICYMLLGPKNAEKLGKNATIFTDVAADRWSAGYIAYCSNLGIIAGNGDGTFNPEGQLTGVAFGKMLLTALGYDAEVEGYVNNLHWATNIATDMINAGIDVDVVLDLPLSRDNAAQMAFNTLFATTVAYSQKTEVVTGGATVTVSGGRYEVYGPGTGAAANFKAFETDGAGKCTVQFAEKYFSQLTKNSVVVDGLEGHTYSWKGIVVSNWEMDGRILATVTDGTRYAMLGDKSNMKYLGYFIDELSDGTDAATLYINGVQQTGASVSAPKTNKDYSQAELATALDTNYAKRGVVMYFQDTNFDGEYDNIAVTKDAVAKVAADPLVKTSGEVTTVTISGIAGMNKVDIRKVTTYDCELSDLSKGDYVMWHKDAAGNFFITKCEVVTGVMTDVNYIDEEVYIDGEAVETSEIFGAQSVNAIDNESKNKASTFWMDQGGYVVKAIADEDVVNLTNTAFVLGEQAAGYSAQAKLLFADGSCEVVNVTKVDTASVDGSSKAALTAAVKTFVTFDKTESGSYELQTITNNTQNTYTANDNDDDDTATGMVPTLDNAADLAYSITKNQANFLTKYTYSGSQAANLENVLATADTVFVYDRAGGGYAATTGISKTASYLAQDDNGVIAYLCDADGYAIFVVAYGGDKDNTTTTTDYVFITGNPVKTYINANNWYETYPAVVNGEITTIEATKTATWKDDNATTTATLGKLFSVTAYDGNRVETADQATGACLVDLNGSTGTIALGSIDNFVLNGYTLKYLDNGSELGSGIVNDNTRFYLWNSMANRVEEITVDQVDALTGGAYSIQIVKKAPADTTIAYMFIAESNNSDKTMSTTIAKTATPNSIEATETATATFAATANTEYVLKVTVDPNAAITYTINGGAATATAGEIIVTSGASSSNTLVAITVTNGQGAGTTYTITLAVA